MDQLPKDVATSIQGILGSYNEEVKAKIPKANEYTVSNVG